MKIAIIGNGFTGATLPLAKHLHENGHEVRCFYIVKVGSSCIESLDFEKKIGLSFKPQLLNKTNRIYNYLDKETDIHLLSVFRRRPQIEKFLIGNIIAKVNEKIISKQIRQILSFQMDYAIVIVHTDLEAQICESLQLKGIPFCVVFHEVLTSHSGKAVIKPLVIDVLKYASPIIIHSQKTKSDLLKYCPISIDKNKLHLFHFGPFESYTSYGKGKSMNIGKDYFLYLGYIFPHKGLKYLYEAVCSYKEVQTFRYVVAGCGKDPVLEKMKKDSHFIVINRYIENCELVNLIHNCKSIVCPYISGSQSGLVQTGMCFNKPIVATKVAAFEEIIKEGENGFLAEPANVNSLANALIKAASCKNPLTTHTSELYDWQTISKQYIDLMNSTM